MKILILNQWLYRTAILDMKKSITLPRVFFKDVEVAIKEDEYRQLDNHSCYKIKIYGISTNPSSFYLMLSDDNAYISTAAPIIGDW